MRKAIDHFDEIAIYICSCGGIKMENIIIVKDFYDKWAQFEISNEEYKKLLIDVAETNNEIYLDFIEHEKKASKKKPVKKTLKKKKC